MSGRIVDIPDAQGLAKLLRKADGPLLVAFWASWCPYCRRLRPTLDALAAEYVGRVTIASVDTEAQPDLEREWDIGLIPAVLLFDGDQLIRRWVNEQDAASYRRVLDEMV